MNYLVLFLIISFSSFMNADRLSTWECYELEGAKIIAEDGTFLGTLDDHYDSESIYNDYSDHGSDYCSDCIWNEYSDYGSDYSSESPFNEYASDPPILIKDGEVVGTLTTDPYDYDGVDPRTVGKDCDWED